MFGGVAYFILESIPLVALGVSAVIVGSVWLSLSAFKPKVSREFGNLLLETAEANIAELLEELGVGAPAIYLPASRGNGRPLTVVPLTNGTPPDDGARKKKADGIVRFRADSEQVGLSVTTSGTVAVRYLTSVPRPNEEELGAALTTIMRTVFDIASHATVIAHDHELKILVRGVNLSDTDVWYYRYLGSPIGSIAAAIACVAYDAPVRICEETRKGTTVELTLEVMT